MQKHFSDVLQMLFVPEIPILGIILKLLGAENKKNEFQKHFPSSVKLHKRLQQSIVFHKHKKYKSRAFT